MQLANQEAQRFNHEYVGPEHILLGVIKEGTGVGINVLNNLNIDPRKIRTRLEASIQSGPEMVTMGKLPMTPNAKKLIEFAMEEQTSLQHNYIGSEHLVLALMRLEDHFATELLRNETTFELAREEVLQLLGSGEPTKDEKRNNSKRSDVGKLCEQIQSLSHGDRIRALKQLWSEGKVKEETPPLTTVINSCSRNGEVVQIDIGITNISLDAYIITGYEYSLASHLGGGTCYLYSKPGESQRLQIEIHTDDHEGTISLMGYDPMRGIPNNLGKKILSIPLRVDESS